jgi:hypothetical protein
MICNCGKNYETEKKFINHQRTCKYVELDLKKVLTFGYMLDEVDRHLFHVPLSTIKKYSKDNNVNIENAKKELKHVIITHYKKSLWDILLVWEHELLVSEYRQFAKWVWKTYKDISLISLRNILSNKKIIYKYHLESTPSTIKKRINDSLIYIHEIGEFHNDFEFVDVLFSGKVSIFYVLFNDWLATQWYGRLDSDLQNGLLENVNLASKIILDRLKPDEFDMLQKLACSNTPVIHAIDF